jgi:hypothetical protein
LGQLRFLCVSIARRPRRERILIEESRRQISCPRLSAAPRAVSSHRPHSPSAGPPSCLWRYPTCFLSARRRGVFVFKTPGRRLHSASLARHALLVADGTAGLSPPTSKGYISRLSHRCARQRGPCIDALSMGLLQQLGAGVRRESSLGNLGILFGTGQVRLRHRQGIRLPSTGSNPGASWQRLRLTRDGPRDAGY